MGVDLAREGCRIVPPLPGRRLRLVKLAARLRAAEVPRQVARDARQPRPRRAPAVRRIPERDQPRLLHQVLGRRLAGDERCREPSQPGGLREQFLDRDGAARHGSNPGRPFGSRVSRRAEERGRERAGICGSAATARSGSDVIPCSGLDERRSLRTRLCTPDPPCRGTRVAIRILHATFWLAAASVAHGQRARDPALQGPASLSGACPEPGFPGKELALGHAPTIVKAADLDGDHDLDLLLNNFPGPDISVARNAGDGRFLTSVDHDLPGASASELELVDLDGDGDLDLVAALWSPAGTLAISMNQGNGSFVGPTLHPLGTPGVEKVVSSVTSGDLDGDGDRDVAYALSYLTWTGMGPLIHPHAGVLRNDGGGAFVELSETPLHFDDDPTSSSYPAVVCARIDGDAHPDLVFAMGDHDEARVLYNVGDATAWTQADFAVSGEPHALIAEDLDGDGEADLVLSRMDGRISVLRAQGTGFLPEVPYLVGTSPGALTSADLDQDGDRDLAVAIGYPLDVAVLLNHGNGTFAPAEQFVASLHPSSIASGDLDGDGLADLATVNGTTAWVLFNSDDGRFGRSYASGGDPMHAASSDLDGDGDLDLAVASYQSNRVSVLANEGTGSSYAPMVQYLVGARPTALLSADLDGDGDADVAAANRNASTVSVLSNRGDGTFAAHLQYAAGSTPRAITSADLDLDGDLDLMLTNDPDAISVLVNLGNGAFPVRVPFAVGASPVSLFGSDFDRDGYVDLAVACAGPDVASLLRNVGGGTFAAEVQFPVELDPSGITGADYDGDGDCDLAVTNATSHSVSVLLATGSGSFGAASHFDVAALSSPLSLVSADLQRDGRADLAVVGDNSYALYLLLNQGNGSFGPALETTAGQDPTFVTSADLDGDGDADLVVTERQLDQVRLLLNACR